MVGRQTPEHGYTICPPCERNGSGELITKYFFLSATSAEKMSFCRQKLDIIAWHCNNYLIHAVVIKHFTHHDLY